MSETVEWNGQTLYAPVIACRAVRAEDFPPDRLAMWREIEKDVGVELNIYPGSIYQPCEDCGIQVAVGPRQQEAVAVATEVGLLAHVCCFIDATVRMNAPDVEEPTAMHLGNPFRKA